MEPTTLTAAAIAAIAFTKSVEVAAEKLTEGTIALLQQLREKIARKLQGKKKAEEALQQLEAGDETSLERVVPYLQVEMEEDETFAREVQQLAQTIEQQININWADARSTSIGEQIVLFCQIEMGAKIPEELGTIAERLAYCWAHWEQWCPGAVLLVFDNVERDRFAEEIVPFCPVDAKFQVLMTTRDRNWSGIETLPLEVLTPEQAKELLLVYAPRVEGEKDAIAELLEWLGYLPLGVELAGRYLALDEFLSVAEYLEELKAAKLAHESIAVRDEEMKYPHGIEAAIRLSWQKLGEAAQLLVMRLSLYALAPIPLTDEQVKQYPQTILT